MELLYKRAVRFNNEDECKDLRKGNEGRNSRFTTTCDKQKWQKESCEDEARLDIETYAIYVSKKGESPSSPQRIYDSCRFTLLMSSILMG